MGRESGLMRAMKLQKAARLCRTIVSAHFLPSIKSIAIPIATGNSWCAGPGQTGTGELLWWSHLENHHSGANGVRTLSQKHTTISPQGRRWACLTPDAGLCQLMKPDWEWSIKKQSVGGKWAVKGQSFFGQSGSWEEGDERLLEVTV